MQLVSAQTTIRKPTQAKHFSGSTQARKKKINQCMKNKLFIVQQLEFLKHEPLGSLLTDPLFIQLHALCKLFSWMLIIKTFADFFISFMLPGLITERYSLLVCLKKGIRWQDKIFTCLL